MIGIVDYGMGNLFSVRKALERLNVPYQISESPEELQTMDGLILPGVGSFKDAMELLNEKKLTNFLLDYTAKGKPLLGICLGMQLLFEESEENGYSKGLSLLKGKIKRIPAEGMNETFKIPHMGWNQLKFQQENPVVEKVEEGFVYFVHSYYATEMDKEELIASTQYNVEIPAIVGKGNILGMQFHPEKSGEVGMQLLNKYTKLVESGVFS
ncbi:glutamine amidotransferase [Oikeobacillus pervagus]|uniref:Imidazole glycerol phosphate synthase subunit HisH n=1 Tax=Oikeobacillus pervagus TaxID=1325931 RepID=A0AAJ1WJW6_9BACI|nr:imidazole glycerol phosphate synthase subunit HisH [Oikeobacillus pervagus]MDQ0215953.1 glutamine amidotransferase [Oikeobacillus pervagus]